MRRVVAALVLAGCGGSPDPRRAAVQGELIGPYTDALRAGDLAGARDRFWSARHRAETADVLWRAGHARDVASWGAFSRLRLTDEAFDEVEDPARGDLLRAAAVWEGERGSAEIVLDLVREDGAWRIDQSWWWPRDGVGTPRVF